MLTNDEIYESASRLVNYWHVSNNLKEDAISQYVLFALISLKSVDKTRSQSEIKNYQRKCAKNALLKWLSKEYNYNSKVELIEYLDDIGVNKELNNVFEYVTDDITKEEINYFSDYVNGSSISDISKKYNIPWSTMKLKLDRISFNIINNCELFD